jgi:hypothetical protein
MGKSTATLVAQILAHLREDARSHIPRVFPGGQWVDGRYCMKHPTDEGLMYVVFPDFHWELQDIEGVLIRLKSGEPILGQNFAFLFKRMYGSENEAAAARDLAQKLGLPITEKTPRK